MKILLVSDAHRVGGAEHYLSLLVSGLVGMDHDVEIICPERKEWADLAQGLKQKGAVVHQLPLKSRHDLGRFHFLSYLNVAQILLLKRYYKRINPDILHINTAGVEDAQTCIIASKRSLIKTTIVTNHAGGFLPYSVKNINIKIIDALRKRIVRKLDSYIEKRIAVSKATVDMIIREYNIDEHKFHIIHNGVILKKSNLNVDQAELKNTLGVNKEDSLMICVANLYKEKGIDYLLKAMPEVLKNNTNVKLVIAGDGPLHEELNTLSKELSVSDNVKFLGKRNDIDSLLSISDIFVLPSLGEGFPFVVLEAMAAGLPVVATNIGGIPEIINDGQEGYLVKPADSGAIAESLKKLLLDTELFKKIADNSKARVEKEFSLSKMIDGTLSVYNEVLGGIS